MAKRTALGKGLDSLIPTDVSDLIEEKFDVTASGPSLAKDLSIDQINPNEHQPRVNFKDGAMADLANSIQTHGVIQPIVVTPNSDGSYNLIAGERRLRASKHLKLKTIPAIIRTSSEQQNLELAIVENVQRENLGPLEMATAYVKLHQQFNLSYKEVAAKVGKAESTVLNVTRLLNLTPEAKEALHNKDISEGHARVLAGMNELPAERDELLKKILSEGLSVRQAEQFSIVHKTQLRARNAAKSEDIFKARETAVNQIHLKLSSPVELKPRAQGGRIVIDYKDDEDLQRLAGLM